MSALWFTVPVAIVTAFLVARTVRDLRRDA